MELTGFRPREQKNSGADGVRLLAERTSDARQVILHVLRQAAVDPVRWSELTRHLNRVKLLSHPGAIPLLELHLLGDTPFVVAAGAELKSLAEPGEGRPWELDRAMRLGHALANALSAAHRLGLCHGRLELDDVWTRGGDDWQLDFSGCRTKTRHEQGADGNDSPPEEAGGRPGTPAGDIFRLARLLSQLAAPAPPTDPAPQSVHSLDAPRPPVVSPVERSPLAPCPSRQPARHFQRFHHAAGLRPPLPGQVKGGAVGYAGADDG